MRDRILSRSLIVPRFVLGELQTLSDSRDPIKRERGKRGLDILNQLQKSRDVDLTIMKVARTKTPKARSILAWCA
ncbi:MAG: hypothetical protein ABJB69_05505 [Spartobacteria bacterium]